MPPDADHNFGNDSAWDGLPDDQQAAARALADCGAVLQRGRSGKLRAARFSRPVTLTPAELGAQLAALPDLIRLELADAAVGDPLLPELARLTNLTHLDLQGAAITDEGLRSLATLKKLKTLLLGGVAVTPAALKTLRQSLLSTRIVAQAE